MLQFGRAMIRGALGQTAAVLVTVVVGMILLPFILSALGWRMYAVWLIVGVILGYYGLLDLGLSSSVSRFVSRSLGQKNMDQANGYITTSLYLFSALGLVSLGFSLLVIFLCPVFFKDSAEAMLMQQVVAVMAVATALSFPGRAFQGVLVAHIRYDLISVTTIVIALARAVLIFWVLRQGGQLLALATVSASLNLVRYLMIIIMARIVHGPVSLHWKHFHRDQVKTLCNYGFYTFLAQISDLLRSNVFPFIISAFMTLEAVTPYGIAARLRVMLTRLAASVFSGLTPAFSHQDGRGDSAVMKKTYFFMYKLSCYLGIFMIGVMSMVSEDFIRRWIGWIGQENLERVVPVLLVLLVGALAGMIQMPTVNYLYGTSQNRFYAITNAIEGITNVILSIWLIRYWGLLGVAVGTAAASIVSKLIIQPFWICRSFQMSLKTYHLKYTLVNLLIPGIFIAVVFVILPRFLKPDYVTLLSLCSAVLCLFVVYIYRFGFTESERDMLRNVILGRKRQDNVITESHEPD